MVDVLVPSIDGLFIMEEMQEKQRMQIMMAQNSDSDLKPQTQPPRFKFSDDPCLAGFMGEWGPPPTVDGMQGEYDKVMKKRLLTYRGSVACKLLNMKRTVKEMKKDRYFFDNLLQHIEQILIQSADENMKYAKNLNQTL